MDEADLQAANTGKFPLEDRARHVLSELRGEQAVRYKGEWFGWSWLAQAAGKVSDALRESGAGPAELAFVPRNRPSAVAALLALIADRRSVFMIYAYQGPEALARNITAVGKRVVLLAREDFSPQVQAAVEAMGAAAIVLDDEGGAELAVKAAAEGDRPAGAPSINILTSGTTGTPKHFRMPYSLISDHVVGANMVPPSTGGDGTLAPTLIYFPFANISGLYHYLPVLMSGGSAILLDKFNLEAWLDYVDTYQPPIGALPPPGVQMVLEAGVAPERLSCMEFLNTGAAAVDPTVHRTFEARYGVPLLLSYGATEFGGPVAFFTPELYREWGPRKFGSVGRAWGGATLRVVDPVSGEPLPAGEEGLLEVISPRMGPDWIRTSDIAVLDEDGFLYHRGRHDGAIARGGFKILPEVIERAIREHPAVAVASVVGLPDARLGQVPAAAVQLQAGAPAPTEQELMEHLRARLYATHMPVKIRFLPDLPRTPSLKVDLRKVAAMLAEEDS